MSLIYREIFLKCSSFLQVKEWLCLTCQMQRALAASESMHPPQMKVQASPSKVSTPTVAKAEDIGQKADAPDKKRLENQPAGAPHSKEESQLGTKDKSSSVSVQKKEDTTGLPLQKDLQNKRITSETDATKVGSDLTKPLLSEAPSVNTEVKTVHPKEKDATIPGATTIKAVTDKKQDKTEANEAMDRQLKLTETPGSGTLPPSSSPKSPRAASKTTEAVTGKMFGFGSSLFSSASTLITSAVQESRTPPSSRKMSAPAQVSEKMASSVESPKASPNVSPRITSTKEAKPVTGQKLSLEKRPDSTQQVKSSPSDQDRTVDRTSTEPGKTEESVAAPKVGKSTCPLCKADLNIGSSDPPNYNNCTECKSDVCNKCGFSPMPSAKEVTLLFWVMFQFELMNLFLNHMYLKL